MLSQYTYTDELDKENHTSYLSKNEKKTFWNNRIYLC